MMTRSFSSLAPSAVLPVRWLVVLCAEWCGTCRDYRAVMEAAAARFPGWRTAWIDIEDQSDLVDELEIETFPTVLLYQQGASQPQAVGVQPGNSLQAAATSPHALVQAAEARSETLDQLFFFGPMLPQEGRLLRQLEQVTDPLGQARVQPLPPELQTLADWLRRGCTD